jgi:hypothetical protein
MESEGTPKLAAAPAYVIWPGVMFFCFEKKYVLVASLPADTSGAVSCDGIAQTFAGSLSVRRVEV